MTRRSGAGRPRNEAGPQSDPWVQVLSFAEERGERPAFTTGNRSPPAPVLSHVARGPVDGSPIVLLHGFTGSAATMAGLAGPLADRHRVVSVDLPGHGRSPSPPDVESYSMASTLSALGALDLGPSAFVGYSMGGRIALSYAAAYPERVNALVLIGATAGLVDPDERAARVAADEALADSIDRDGLEAFVDRWMAVPLFASQARLGADALAASRRQRLTNDPLGLANSLRGIGTGAMPPLWDRLAALPMPVLLIVGAEDPKFTALAGRIAAALPRAEIVSIPEAGHAAHLEQPLACADVVGSFLAS